MENNINTNNLNNKYNHILNKKFSLLEKYFIIKKNCFTDNILYYFFCIFFRFIHLVSIYDYYIIDQNQTNNNNLQKYFKAITCHNIFKPFHISFKTYAVLILFILLLVLIRVSIYYFIVNNIDNYYIYNNKLLSRIKYQKFIDHFIFLLFTHLIEFLSFSYYIFFIPDKFIIKAYDENQIYLIIIMIVSTILIIVYNIDNYINIISINKLYRSTIFEVHLRLKDIKNFNKYKTIQYKCSNKVIYIFVMQLVISLYMIDHYLIHIP